MLLRSEPGEGYRLCVGVALFAHDGRVFLGKRVTRGVVPQYSWQMPQGGINRGEPPEPAARRELYEETSVRSVGLLGAIEGWLHYDLPTDMGSWRGRYRGQAQRWFAYRFEGDDSEIDVTHPPDGHHAEFSRWKWADLAATPALVVPFKRAVYEAVIAEFACFATPTAPLRDVRPQAM